MSEMTASEKAWFNKLYRLMSAMPATVEIEVHNDNIQMGRKGSRQSAFDRYGDVDNADRLDKFITVNMRVYPVSESV